MSTNQPSSNINVSIRIEPTDEYQIYEISYDGEEHYIPPLSMSEHLSKLIHKIDFNQPIDELKKELETTKTDDEATANTSAIEKTSPTTTTPAQTWPFESVRRKLMAALTEICVLTDVLSIAKAKKYMVFDAVNHEQSDTRPIVELMAKKRALQTAALVLTTGVETLQTVRLSKPNPLAESSSLTAEPEPNFYDELIEMRQNWRLKRVGSNIIGDLSYYRPTGFRLTGNNRFEAIKTTPETRDQNNPQALSVQVPADLEGRAYIQVSIIKDDEISLLDLGAAATGRTFESVNQTTWQEKLDAAQNVSFCKELFNQLAREAVTYQFVIPTTVTGNQIILALFPDVKLYITLVHHTPHTKCSREVTEGMKKLEKEHKPVFEHSLHRMLRDYYALHVRKMQGQDFSKEQGPCAHDKQTIEQAAKFEGLLEQIVMQSQHLIMRQQTMNVIDTFAATIKDPMIVSHWFCLNNPTSSIVRLDIVSHNNEVLGRAHMLIYVGTRQLRVITRECKNLYLGYEPDELRNLLVWQSCLHQFNASLALSKLLGWVNLSLNYNIGAVRDREVSTAFSVVMLSPNCDYILSIKSGPFFGLVVSVAQFKDSSLVTGLLNSSQEPMTNGHNNLGSDLSGDEADQDKLSRFQDLVGPFREVDWELMHGKDFLSKFELIMAALTDLKI